jgi:similar to spore coat protein
MQNQEVSCVLQQKLALHETMEIHELLNLKTACLMKSKMLQGLVFDQELKALMEKDVQQSITATNMLQGLLTDTMSN